MTELTVTRDRENKRVFVLESVGRVVVVPKKWWGAIRVEVDGVAPWTVTLPGWNSTKKFEAVDERGATVATFTQVGVRGGVIASGGRELSLASEKPGGAGSGPWILSESDREIARFPRKQWGVWKNATTVTDDEAFRRDPRLALFAAWVAQKISWSVAP